MVDAGDTGQRIANSRALIFIFRANFDMIPMTDDGQRLIIVLRTLRMFPVKILMKRNRTDWLLMVISGNNLMINFIATIVRWQARRGYKQSCKAAHTGACILGAEYITIARYLLTRVTSLPYPVLPSRHNKSLHSLCQRKMRPRPALKLLWANPEQIVNRLESGDLPLEEALSEFERGVQLARQGKVSCRRPNSACRSCWRIVKIPRPRLYAGR